MVERERTAELLCYASLCTHHPRASSSSPHNPTTLQYEEWEDPSGGLLTEIFDACENDDAGALTPLLGRLEGTQWTINARGADGDSPL